MEQFGATSTPIARELLEKHKLKVTIDGVVSSVRHITGNFARRNQSERGSVL